ncbi:response regulator [Litorivicinus lipolyticus]|uniref:Response regulator n=1 Tax=Litorivicinus lipolyticus TaxID=418701 RepID=A0A5Q2QDL3_9GAMM|nr:response regulator [Litorivicinus lipolyticus]QGG79105.1 response regulator [Litorivicinus lipolyticus]
MTGNPEGTLLIIEDSDDDYLFTKRAFKKAKLANPLNRCSGGDEALDYLFRRNGFEDAERPSIILLDLNMPGTNGHQVLAQIKADDQLCRIPVIVLTTSDDPRDIERCYKAGANSYVQKPVDLDGFVTAMSRLKDYWFEIALLPDTTDS